MTCDCGLLIFDGADSPINPLQVNAPDLLAWLQAKDATAIGSWNEIGRDEYTRAFTAAQTAGYDVVNDLYQGFLTALQTQQTEREFSDSVIPILKAKGWLADNPGELATRVALIFDTNLRMARGAGQWDRIQASKGYLPYLRGVTAQDYRVRHPPKSKYSDHRAFQDIILPVDHPFWTRYFVPLGFRCRCQILQVSRSKMQRNGWTVTSPDDLAGRESRLGPPVFSAPGGGVLQQVSKAVQLENDDPNRMPGLPTVDITAQRRAAAAAWAQANSDSPIAGLINKLIAG